MSCLAAGRKHGPLPPVKRRPPPTCMQPTSQNPKKSKQCETDISIFLHRYRTREIHLPPKVLSRQHPVPPRQCPQREPLRLAQARLPPRPRRLTRAIRRTSALPRHGLLGLAHQGKRGAARRRDRLQARHRPRRLSRGQRRRPQPKLHALVAAAPAQLPRRHRLPPPQHGGRPERYPARRHPHARAPSSRRRPRAPDALERRHCQDARPQGPFVVPPDIGPGPGLCCF